MSGAGVQREAVKISTGEEGLFIQAILSSPLKPPNQRRVVIFSQAGLQNKSGVGDYYRWLGDELSSLGYDVLRFDQLFLGNLPILISVAALGLPLPDFIHGLLQQRDDLLSVGLDIGGVSFQSTPCGMEFLRDLAFVAQVLMFTRDRTLPGSVVC